MATATMATAVGAAALLYYTFKRKGSEILQDATGSSRPRVRLGLARHAPSTWFEAITTLSETLRFTYSETLGKWPIADLAFGINFLMKRQGQLDAARIYAVEGCSQELDGPEVLAEVKELILLITACIHFSKKPFPQFLEATGYSTDSVLLQEPKAGLLKPAFTILVDENLQSILLLVRGTHSVKDTLTAVTGAVVPFHHTVLDEGGVSNIVLGYAHCGMVAAARWIAQLATPILLQAQKDYPTFKFKIVGHSLGGGTAALLTYILRERKEFSSVNCICFAPAACMTWELAESGKPFTTSVVNGSDIVPTFSAASMDDLRAEVTASAWVNDLREQIERVKFLKALLRSTTALSNHISSISRPLYPYLGDAAKAGVATAWRPVSSGTQVVMKQAQTVVNAVVRTRPSLGLAGWSCMGARRRTVVSHASLDNKELIERTTEVDETVTQTRKLITSSGWSHKEVEHHEFMESGHGDYSTDQGSDSEMQDLNHHDYDDHDDELQGSHENGNISEITEEYLLEHLERELSRQREACLNERKEEEEVAKKLTQEEEEEVAATAAKAGNNRIVTDVKAQGREMNRFFPPGRIIHLLTLDAPPETLEGEGALESTEDVRSTRIGLFSTDRSLYGKVHLSRTMINDHFMPIYKRMMESLVKDLERKMHDTLPNSTLVHLD